MESSENRTTEEASALAWPLAMLTKLVIRLPVMTLLTAGIIAVASVCLAINHLGFKTSRLDLINPQSSFNQLWLDYLDQFSADDDVVVIIEGENREVIVPVMEELYTRLAADDQSFYAVLHEKGLNRVREKGLHFVSDDELKRIDQELLRLDPVLDGNWEAIGVAQMVWGLNQQLLWARNNPNDPAATQVASESSKQLDRLGDNLLAALGEDRPDQPFWSPPSKSLTAMMSQIDSDYFLANEGQMGLIMLRLVKQGQSFSQGTEAINRLRGILDQFKRSYPKLRFGLTGLPVMENDEMQRSQIDMTEASIVSLIGVSILFCAGFGGLRHPLLAVGTLIVGLACAVGFITLGVGHLNILSVSFGVILIGLGIDFGIHYVARYLKSRGEGATTAEALVGTARDIGPGIFTGGVTTAVAFFTASLTDFTGVAELGIIAGGGLLICLVVSLTVLPASIYLADRNRNRHTLPRPLKVESWIYPLLRAPRWTLAFSLILCVGAGFGARRMQYDHNLLNLQPVDVESVQWEHKLLNDSDRSVWFALSIAPTRQELLARKQQFEQLKSVDRVEEIASLIPVPSHTKLDIIRRVHERLEDLPETPHMIDTPQAGQLGQLLADSQRLLLAEDDTAQSAYRRLGQVREILRGMSQTRYQMSMASLQQRTAGELLQWLYSLQAVSNPEPPSTDDLPEALVTRFVGKNNQLLLRIYPQGSIWDMEDLERFVADVESVDSKATGQPLQTFYASRQMQNSYIQAAIYSLIVVLIILLIDFRSLRHSMLAILPVGFGALLMFGILGFNEIPLNPANMIVLPLILGIGIDDGVHVVHDYRRQRGGYRLGASTAAGIVVTSLTTMIGFGSLMLAEHRGLASLGRVLTIGVACCLFTSLVMLPAILTLISPRREEEKPADRKSHPLGNRSQPPGISAAPGGNHSDDSSDFGGQSGGFEKSTGVDRKDSPIFSPRRG